MSIRNVDRHGLGNL
jgi:hypothetical protein